MHSQGEIENADLDIEYIQIATSKLSDVTIRSELLVSTH